jgi:hypothetical protein
MARQACASVRFAAATHACQTCHAPETGRACPVLPLTIGSLQKRGRTSSRKVVVEFASSAGGTWCTQRPHGVSRSSRRCVRSGGAPRGRCGQRSCGSSRSAHTISITTTRPGAVTLLTGIIFDAEGRAPQSKPPSSELTPVARTLPRAFRWRKLMDGRHGHRSRDCRRGAHQPILRQPRPEADASPPNTSKR